MLPSRWQPGKIYKVSSDQLTIVSQQSGHADVDIGVTINHNQYFDLQDNEPAQTLGEHGVVRAVGNDRLLKLTAVPIHL